MSDTNTDIIERLKQASADLLFMSESDYLFEVFQWSDGDSEPLSAAELLQRTGHPAETPIEVVELDYFFRNAVTPQDWHGEAEQAAVEKYQALVEVLKSHLSDVKVYRLGEIEIDVYIVGKTHSREWVGLSTKVIET